MIFVQNYLRSFLKVTLKNTQRQTIYKQITSNCYIDTILVALNNTRTLRAIFFIKYLAREQTSVSGASSKTNAFVG